MEERRMRIVITVENRSRPIAQVLPVLVSSELTEELSGLAGPDDQIFVDSMHVPIPGVETGDQVLDLRLALHSPQPDKASARRRAGIGREVPAGLPMFHQVAERLGRRPRESNN